MIPPIKRDELLVHATIWAYFNHIPKQGKTTGMERGGGERGDFKRATQGKSGGSHGMNYCLS